MVLHLLPWGTAPVSWRSSGTWASHPLCSLPPSRPTAANDAPEIKQECFVKFIFLSLYIGVITNPTWLVYAWRLKIPTSRLIHTKKLANILSEFDKTWWKIFEGLPKRKIFFFKNLSIVLICGHPNVLRMTTDKHVTFWLQISDNSTRIMLVMDRNKLSFITHIYIKYQCYKHYIL